MDRWLIVSDCLTGLPDWPTEWTDWVDSGHQSSKHIQTIVVCLTPIRKYTPCQHTKPPYAYPHFSASTLNHYNVCIEHWSFWSYVQVFIYLKQKEICARVWRMDLKWNSGLESKIEYAFLLWHGIKWPHSNCPLNPLKHLSNSVLTNDVTCSLLGLKYNGT